MSTKSKSKSNKLFSIIVIFALLSGIVIVGASTLTDRGFKIHKVTTGSAILGTTSTTADPDTSISQIRERGKCFTVTNSAAAPLFVPTNSSSELTKFLSSPPPWHKFGALGARLSRV